MTTTMQRPYSVDRANRLCAFLTDLCGEPVTVPDIRSVFPTVPDAFSLDAERAAEGFGIRDGGDRRRSHANR